MEYTCTTRVQFKELIHLRAIVAFDSFLLCNLCNYSPKEGWKLRVRRNLNDWVLTALTDLLLFMQGHQGNTDERDRVWWIPSSDGELSVATVFLD
ncbi:hypothetical protein H5410_044247 [Solanum commersonii]|uniref:Uncharacterized protein n=1 Tax=Solanum commersonii TaxID=4109 RepID=A0A9J5X8J9_SOLCO|nr:hypothetical protein H5410_044247 [Solanum commersonii]